MDSSEPLTVLRLAAAFAVLSYASVLDWRTRRIGNPYWISLSLFGLLLIPIQIVADEEPMEYCLIFVPIIAILSDVYWDTGGDAAFAKFAPAMKYTVALASLVIMGYFWVDSEYFQHLVSVPVMMLFIVVMYMADLIRGGADAKALISLSVLFPFHPILGSFPILQSQTASAEILFPFSFVVLVTAAILVALFPLGFLVKNVLAREFKSPQGFLGYKMNADELKGKHVWLMERMEDGGHRVYTRPRHQEDLEKEARLLMGAGHKRVWVTPKIPFIIPIVAALAFSTVVGNILLLIFQV